MTKLEFILVPFAFIGIAFTLAILVIAFTGCANHYVAGMHPDEQPVRPNSGAAVWCKANPKRCGK